MSNTKAMPTRRGLGDKWIVWTAILAVMLIVICAAALLAVRQSITAGVNSARDEFTAAYGDARSAEYTKFKEKAYEIAEKTHHVSNDVTISLNAVKEKSNLEVLKISDVVYIIDDGKENDSGTISWLKVNGTGVFTVDLKAAEYLVDNSRCRVMIRVPTPVLDNKNISIDDFESLLFNENKWEPSNSIKNGEELAREQLSEAQSKMQEDFEANENYSKLAKSLTESMLRTLIQSLNPDIPDLEVDVEFF